MTDKFPYLNENDFFVFPSVESATSEGIVAAGGNLSPGMLLSAYRQGIFPWFSYNEAILWWSPDPRLVLFPSDIYISKTMKKVMKRSVFSFTFDTAFPEVISRCGNIPRKEQDGTWITESMIEAYIRLHKLGYAHSVEVWQDNDLCGGLYGVSLGRCFFGESMFSIVSNASKAALIFLARTLSANQFRFIDCQVYTEHLETLGAVSIPRSRFLELLKESILFPDIYGDWNEKIDF